mmetsp:Transcript_35151/g.74211  ORF Transcript_35151/g.74211 Transcript_35151/m.74211 type:complete len:232 (-) Transcript_35151:12-707(-)
MDGPSAGGAVRLAARPSPPIAERADLLVRRGIGERGHRAVGRQPELRPGERSDAGSRTGAGSAAPVGGQSGQFGAAHGFDAVRSEGGGLVPRRGRAGEDGGVGDERGNDRSVGGGGSGGCRRRGRCYRRRRRRCQRRHPRRGLISRGRVPFHHRVAAPARVVHRQGLRGGNGRRGFGRRVRSPQGSVGGERTGGVHEGGGGGTEGAEGGGGAEGDDGRDRVGTWKVAIGGQ